MVGFKNSSIPNLNPHLNVTSLDGFHVHIFWICVQCFNVLLGPPTHIYVRWLIVTGKGIASEFLNFQACVSEIIICVNSFLMLLEIWFTEISVTLSFAVGLTITGRPLFQCLMCVERYLAVVHLVTFLKFKPLRYRVISCTVVWIITLGSSLGCMFTLGLVYIYSCFFSLQFLLFLSIQLFCLVAVLRALKQSGPGERKSVEENHMKRRAFYLILITTVSMTIINVPFIISGLFFILTQEYIEEIFTVGLFYFGWFCSACSLSEPGWKSLLSLLSIKP